MTYPIELDRVSVNLGGKPILHEVSLALRTARLVALLGPNGAGKTTLLRAMAGLIPASGDIRIEGTPLHALNRQARARRIAYLPQGHQVHWPLNAHEIVALGRYPHGVTDPARMSDADRRVVEGAMARTDSLHLAGRAVSSLSGGERARIMLSRVLAVGAPLLLADEPTASLDPRHQIAVMQELKAESRRGALVIAVTHDLTLASRLADDIVLMNEGRIVAQGAPADVLTDDRFAVIYGISVLRHATGDEEIITPWGLA
ncbi:MAG TPA: ABC transporter ATP-binding protein [Rhabdaerophilum sp.]|nr:ABC transporter ATP-binding protein [Rhabdaerophilum sp.]